MMYSPPFMGMEFPEICSYLLQSTTYEIIVRSRLDGTSKDLFQSFIGRRFKWDPQVPYHFIYLFIIFINAQ